ncbi:MAG: hypothetical protein ACI83D_000563 [Planctomycetota bacterium]|jgi:hypothetical protein
MSVDPAAITNPSQFIIDPQQLNTYSYVRNNPLVYHDPEGDVAVLAAPALPAITGFVVGAVETIGIVITSLFVADQATKLINSHDPGSVGNNLQVNTGGGETLPSRTLSPLLGEGLGTGIVTNKPLSDNGDPFYRNGAFDKFRPGDFDIGFNPDTGTVSPALEEGFSVNTDPNKAKSFGSADEVGSLPKGIRFQPDSKNPSHGFIGPSEKMSVGDLVKKANQALKNKSKKK